MATKKATKTAVKKAATKKPATKKAVKKTAVKKAATKKPATKKTAVKKATAKAPAVKKAATKKATAKAPAVKKPVVKMPAEVKVKASKTKTSKAKSIVEVADVAPKIPRGYTVKTINKELTIDGVKDLYELIEVTGRGINGVKYFVDDESAYQFINKHESKITEVKALAGKTHAPIGMRSIKAETEELKSLSELAELSDNGIKSDRAAAKVMYSDSE